MNARFALICAGAAVCALGGVASATALEQVRSLAMLDTLRPGNWELRILQDPALPRHICLRDARRLIQLRHPGERCSRIIVEDRATEITVQYTCHGRGYGRTQIRRESDGLVQINAQGIAHGLPFAFSAEARRTGACRG